jgi:FMN-dependent NADH-azoreductase
VTYRDLVIDPVPHHKAATVAAMCVSPAICTPEQARLTAVQEELVVELAATDTLLIGAPMYNFRIPASLRAKIDQLDLSDRIVDQRLFDDTCVVIASARHSACGHDIRREASNYQERHLETTLRRIGMNDISFVRAPTQAAANGKRDLSRFVWSPGKLLAGA